MIQLGIDSFATTLAPSGSVVVSPEERLRHLLAEIGLADQVGIDSSASANVTAPSSSTRPHRHSWCGRRAHETDSPHQRGHRFERGRAIEILGTKVAQMLQPAPTHG